MPECCVSAASLSFYGLPEPGFRWRGLSVAALVKFADRRETVDSAIADCIALP